MLCDKDVIFSRSYHIIVLEGNTSAKSPDKWLPSELGPYNVSTYKAGKPYITAVLTSYQIKFSIGDNKEYKLSNNTNASVVIYKNVALKANTEYLVFQRAYLSEVRCRVC